MLYCKAVNKNKKIKGVQRFIMKRLSKLFLMLVFSLLFLVACGEKAKEEVKTEGTEKKTLTISWNQDVGFLNPHAYLPDQFITQGMVYEGLVN